jgi:hypothetical protein
MENIDIFGWQQLNHEENEAADPHQTYVLTDPPNIIVEGVLQRRNRQYKIHNRI